MTNKVEKSSPKKALRVELFRMLCFRVRIVNFLVEFRLWIKNALWPAVELLQKSQPNYLTLTQGNGRKCVRVRQHESKSTKNVVCPAVAPVAIYKRI